MTSSARPACEDALLALLRADGTLSAIAGPPQLFEPQNPADEHIWISEDSPLTQEATLTGNVPERHEAFDVKVVVMVVKTGPDYKPVRDRGTVLVAAVETIVKANPTLSGNAFYAGVTAIDRTTGAWEKRRGVVHIVTVHCDTYLKG